MWGLETIVQLNDAAKTVTDHREVYSTCGIRVSGNLDKEPQTSAARNLWYRQALQSYNDALIAACGIPFQLMTPILADK